MADNPNTPNEPPPPPPGHPSSGVPPTGQPPTGQPPTGQPPAGQPPVGQPPVGQPPTGQWPTGQPPAGQPPVGQPPAGQWSTGQPTGQGTGRPGGSFDANATKAAFQGANRSDLVIIAAGVLAFIFSLFPYYTASIGGFGGSETAWHGFWGWFAALIALVGAVVLALPLFGMRVSLPTRLLVLICFGVATLCVLIAGLTWPGGDGVPGSVTGHGFGYWASLVVIVVGLVFAVFRHLNKPIPGMPG
jgi:hypothetical protein